MECIIVGAGAVGLITAYQLVTAGADVTLLEQSTAGQEASWAGAGILSPLLPWDYPESVTNLASIGVRLYPHLAHELEEITGIDIELRRTGMLVFPPYNIKLAEQWRKAHATPLQATAAPFSSTSQAIWLEDTFQVRNPRLLASLRRWLDQRKVPILENTRVIRLAEKHSRITQLETNRGIYYPTNTIITAGAWSQQLLGEQALGVNIRPVRGQMLLYKASPGQLDTIVMQNGTYIVPRADGHILVGSTLEDVGFDKSTTPEARRSLHATATTLLPFLHDTPLVGHWAGLRPGSPGNVPTISRHPTLENLYINSGHFRYGVTMAPASARLLLDIMLNRPPLLDPTPYRWPDKP